MTQATGEGYTKLAVETLSLGQSINVDSAITLIYFCLNRGMFSVKSTLDYIQTIHERLNLSFLTFF